MKHSRITTTPGFLDLVDVLGRGGTDEWRVLYRRAQTDVAVREQIRAALPLVDPEIGSGGVIWPFLLEHIEQQALRRSPTRGQDPSEPLPSTRGRGSR